MLFVINTLNANTLLVDINGTGNYTSIQEGIDNSVNDDTVLVYPGTYYENINFNGKSITLTSLCRTTQNRSYIDSTIIDGNQNGSVVIFESEEDSTSILSGFTLQNGSGSLPYGFDYVGGGIGIKNANPKIEKCMIKNNTAKAGGGIFCCNTTTILSGVTIYNNQSYLYGGGIILLDYSTINFDSENPCSIYLNYAAKGCDFYKASTCPPIEIIVDTFTVMNPDSYFVTSVDLYGYPVYDVTMNIFHAKIDPVNQDLYVSPDGNNTNSGLTPDESLQTIAFALTKIASDSLHPNTIHIADGVYSLSMNDEKFPLNMRSYVSLIGESMENTILDGESLSYLINAEDIEKDYVLKNISVVNGYSTSQGGIKIRDNANVSLENISIYNCECSGNSGMVINNTGSLLLKDVYIYNNIGGKALYLTNTDENSREFAMFNCTVNSNMPDDDPEEGYGGGIIVVGKMTIQDIFSGVFKNVEITNNVNNDTDWYPSSVALTVMNNAQVDVINCTIGDNTTPTGGAVKLDYGAEVNIINSILYGDSPRELVVDGRDMPCTLTVQNSLIQGGMWDMLVLGNNTFNWLDGNIDDDPLWIGSGEYPYSLSYGSPCIDSGTIDTTGLHLPAYDLAGNPRIKNGRIDMGAYEYQDTVSVDPSHDHPDWLYTLQNTPNPFHEGTSILFSVHDSRYIKDIILTIYNAKGQLVKRFTSENQEFMPYTEVYWDGTDEQGKQVAPGTYFYKLEYNGNSVVRKMVLLR